MSSFIVLNATAADAALDRSFWVPEPLIAAIVADGPSFSFNCRDALSEANEDDILLKFEAERGFCRLVVVS